MLVKAGRPRLRELRTEAGWTQQQLADKLNYFAWTQGQGRAAVNADMVAKWERGAKGISPRYKALLSQLFGVTPEQLGFKPVPSASPTPPVPDAQSLVSMLDDAASLLDQLGAAGTALAPQMLSAWKDTVTSRRTMLGLLDPAAADPAGHAHAATATVTDLEHLAERYQTLHVTANPSALLNTVAAHVRMATVALGQEHTATQRRRLLRNLAMVATVAGRLAYEDLGDALSGRAYYSVAADSAREANDDQAAATVLGYTAQLAHSEGMTGAALDHLTAALVHAERAPAVAPWLASIQATIHADSGEHACAVEALHRADPVAHQVGAQPNFLPDYGAGHLAAAIGHTHLRASYYTPARDALTAALDQLPPTNRRTEFSSSLISPQLNCVRATFPRHVATPPPPLIYFGAPLTPSVPLACAHSALSQPDRSALAPCASSTNTSPTSPLDDTRGDGIGTLLRLNLAECTNRRRLGRSSPPECHTTRHRCSTRPLASVIGQNRQNPANYR